MRVQLTALYEVHDCHDRRRQNGGGDGTSSGGTSSPGGTTSPDAFHAPSSHRGGFDDALLKAAERKGVVILTPDINVEFGSCLSLHSARP